MSIELAKKKNKSSDAKNKRSLNREGKFTHRLTRVGYCPTNIIDWILEPPSEKEYEALDPDKTKCWHYDVHVSLRTWKGGLEKKIMVELNSRLNKYEDMFVPCKTNLRKLPDRSKRNKNIENIQWSLINK